MLFFMILLVIALLAILVRYMILEGEIRQMGEQISRLRREETNTLLTTTSGNRHTVALANEINFLLEDTKRTRTGFIRQMKELRRTMTNISHDLRTPLTSVLGYLQLMKGETVTEEQRERYLGVVEKKASMLNGFVDVFFDFARLESDTYPLDMGRIDINDCLTETLAAYYADLSLEGGDPVLEISTGPLWAYGDSGAVSRVFSNILQNIVKHRGRDVRIGSGRTDDFAYTSFTNRADGLSQEDVSHLFDLFYVADPTRSEGSTGLGLAIVKEFVEKMYGSVSAEVKEDMLTITVLWKSLK